MYGAENVTFMQLPQQDEIGGKGPDSRGWPAQRAIQQSGARFFDGLELCGLTADDYYADEGHPNPRGYRKIAGCVAEVLKGIAGERSISGASGPRG